MISFYRSKEGATEKIDQVESGCWIDVCEPSEDDIAWLRKTLDISPDFLAKAFDEEESAHSDVDPDNGQILVIIDCPFVAEESRLRGKTITEYDTHPISFLFLPEDKNIVTLSLHENETIEQFAHDKKIEIDTAKPREFMLKALLYICEAYLHDLRMINRQVNEYEKLLRKRITDADLLVMLDFEKSLIYFTTSLQGLAVTISHVGFEREVGITEEEKELLDDVKVEIAQANEMCEIYTQVLEGVTDAFQNVLNNNLNSTMRILTCITLIMAIPTIVFSFYGMNVNDLPLAASGSWFPICLSVILCVVVFLVLKYTRILK